MKEKLSVKQYLVLSSMLFGLFFGAGNLIFPIHMGQLAGNRFALAAGGFCITGVGLPLLGIVAIGVSESNGLFDLGSKAGKGFSYFFTIVLYLTIGPLFAIPRTATVSYQVGIASFVPVGREKFALFLFSLLFFTIVLIFSLRPSGIMTWIGKLLNPIFLVFLAIIVVAVFVKPMGGAANAAAIGSYADRSFITGLLEGYNTMDALASLAFGIILIESVRRLGITQPGKISIVTMRSGVLTVLLMAIIYGALTYAGSQSVEILPMAKDGGLAFYQIAQYYFGTLGGILLGITITFACLKTAIGLVTACGETFAELLPFKFRYRTYAIGFCLFSFGIANIGLEKIIAFSVPVLKFLYPITIVLILTGIVGVLFHYDKTVFRTTITVTTATAVLELLSALPNTVQMSIPGWKTVGSLYRHLPLGAYGMGWMLPAGLGFLVGICIYIRRRNK